MTEQGISKLKYLGFLLLVTLCLSGVSSADSITTILASQGTSVNPNITTSAGNAVAIDPDLAWATAFAGSSWISFGNTSRPDRADYIDVANGTVVTFTQMFDISGSISSAWIKVLADDSAAMLINGITVVSEPSLDNNYLSGTHCSSTPIGCTSGKALEIDIAPFLHTGTNEISFLVAQRAGASFGLNYYGEIVDPSPPDPTRVPEPSSVALLGGGLTLFAGITRRCRTAK